MINFQALNVLLDTLRKVDPRPPPVARVVALRPMLRSASDGSTAANDLHAAVSSTPSRTAPRDFPLAPDPTQGGRLRDPSGSGRVAAQVLLSAGGAELERALRGSTGRLPAAPTIRSNVPLLPAAPAFPLAPGSDVDDRTAVARSVLGLAYALRDAITQSGLFYESHLARWIADDFPQSELDHEPQAATLPHADAAANPVPGALREATANTALALAANAAAGTASDPADARVAPADAPSTQALVRADAAPLLRQQLDVLDTRQFAWVGELWPGQRTAIRFEEDREHQAAHDPSSAGRTLIRAHIILELPELGTIGAEIAIIGGSVHMQITTDGPAATKRLHVARAELAEALAARALPATEIAVFDEL